MGMTRMKMQAKRARVNDGVNVTIDTPRNLMLFAPFDCAPQSEALGHACPRILCTMRVYYAVCNARSLAHGVQYPARGYCSQASSVARRARLGGAFHHIDVRFSMLISSQVKISSDLFRQSQFLACRFINDISETLLNRIPTGGQAGPKHAEAHCDPWSLATKGKLSLSQTQDQV